MNSTILAARLKTLAYRTVYMIEQLPKSKIAQTIEGQVLRSGFSAAANYRAACRAISSRSFVSKLSIAFEEADETLFWLEAVNELHLIPNDRLSLLLQEASELAAS